ncbi:hypothetical protein BC936DRAFT_142372 [Jimgerdemannia flammicorona]|uniref:Anoctamin alpha-beta plait domain-containing protein n=1 Tax=Jimgerdemannia flammicorona TaxID=994334 RepID=A0A433A0Y6_9FUNG|nr:hypothetical protein BC936DRAFT_142372 [Jimgerdemannia flammicorona]
MTDPQPSLVRRARQFLFRSAVGSSADEEGNIFADYVVVFRYPVVGVSDASRAEHEANAVTAFRSFLSKLRSVRLKYEVRYGEKNSLLVFVLCPWERLKTELYRSRINDWLTGVRIADIDDTDSSSVIANALTESERLRLVHEIVTGAVEEGGAGVVPGVDPFVESLFPLHDEEFDKVGWARVGLYIAR